MAHHRPPPCPTAAPAKGDGSGNGPGDRFPGERHGRAFQRPDRGGAAKPPLPFRRRTGNHAAPLCAALQPATSPVGLGQQDPLAGDEGLAQTQAATVQEAAILPHGA